MRLQFIYSESIWPKCIIKKYHDGELVESYQIYADEIDDEIDKLLEQGYNYGFTKEEVEREKEAYENMLANML